MATGTARADQVGGGNQKHADRGRADQEHRADCARADQVCGADQERKAPGRPRSARADEAIVEAVLDLLAEGTPFDGLSMESVAARAGVGKATIYRRWPNKEALVFDAVATVKGEPAQIAGESVRDDLVTLLRPANRVRYSRVGRIMPCLMAELRRSPQLRRIYGQITEPRRELMRSVLRRGMAEGSVRPDLDVDMVVLMLISPMVARAVLNMAADHDPADLAERLVDTVWPAITVG